MKIYLFFLSHIKKNFYSQSHFQFHFSICLSQKYMRKNGFKIYKKGVCMGAIGSVYYNTMTYLPASNRL